MHLKLPALDPGQVDLTPHGQLQLPPNVQEDGSRFPGIIIAGPCEPIEFYTSQLKMGADYLPNSIKE